LNVIFGILCLFYCYLFIIFIPCDEELLHKLDSIIEMNKGDFKYSAVSITTNRIFFFTSLS
jgi:hypothetical protein